MSKLNRYNQKLLAVIGTIVLIIGAGSILLGIGIWLVDEFFDSPKRQETGVLIQDPENPDADPEAPTVKQSLSFYDPVRLDTIGSSYLIPVGQKNQEPRDGRRNYKFGSGEILSYSKGYYQYQIGLHNNFVIYNHQDESRRKVFNQLVAVSQWAYYRNDSNKVLLFKASTEDNNHDAVLDDLDHQKLFVYSIQNQELQEFKLAHHQVIDFKPMESSPLIAIETRLDLNENDIYKYEEPIEYYALNLQTMTLAPLVSTELKTEMQGILDQDKAGRP
ncbi:hypothetical protein [Croceimicrobium sp.]|uniref:hypothetical protein n=1 Tax=Croceimicrobium sp. TaxID=2828340 RepID=UPI003BAD44C7